MEWSNFSDFTSWRWGLFLIRSNFIPLLHFRHALSLLKKKEKEKKGLSSFESVSSQISGIVGMGNISGVAVAISLGGAGAIFWMWITALLGMITKFYTCSLAVLYREKREKIKMLVDRCLLLLMVLEKSGNR